MARGVPVEAGGVHALWRRTELAHELIDVLAAMQREADALSIADALHASRLDALTAKISAAPINGPSSEPLVLPLPERTAVLSLLPAGRKAWTAFLAGADRVRVRRSADPVGDLLPELMQLERLYVISGGDRRAFDLITRTASTGVPIGAVLEVGLLPYARVLMGPAPQGGPSLVIADPTEDLSAAAAEGRSVAGRLKGSILLTGEECTRDAVRARWRQARILHFAGHGMIDARRPWDAHLTS
jgi:hypothetical protein